MTIDPFRAGGIIFALILLEAALSFDNAAILAVLSRKLPAGRDRRRALNYGLGLAYGLRFIAILGAVLLIRNPVFLTLGGVYLVFLCGRHFWDAARGAEKPPRGDRPPASAFRGLSPVQSVVVQIGFVDLAFALDQVVAAVAFTQDVAAVDLVEAGGLHLTYQQALILTASAAGLISLRLLAPVMSRLMDWLPLLEHMAFVAVGFVGLLLLLEHPQVVPSPTAIVDLLEPVKVPATIGLFVVPVALKLVAGWARRRGRVRP